jgi:hypothetical protein
VRLQACAYVREIFEGPLGNGALTACESVRPSEKFFSRKFFGKMPMVAKILREIFPAQGEQ